MNVDRNLSAARFCDGHVSQFSLWRVVALVSVAYCYTGRQDRSGKGAAFGACGDLLFDFSPTRALISYAH